LDSTRLYIGFYNEFRYFFSDRVQSAVVWNDGGMVDLDGEHLQLLVGLCPFVEILDSPIYATEHSWCHSIPANDEVAFLLHGHNFGLRVYVGTQQQSHLFGKVWEFRISPVLALVALEP
jgi:hypothetical protein